MSSAYDSATGIQFNAGQASDQGVFAEFETYPVQNNSKTEAEGRPIFDDKTYIRIRTPGDRRSEVHREAKDTDKQRFPLQWARFQQGMAQSSSGTPLEQWPLMTPATVLNLKAMGVATVEQLASVTDGNLTNLGMGARSLRDQAKAYLERAGEGKETRALAAENAQLREELEALKANMADLAAAVRRKEKADASPEE
jgi:hypothetical protein